MDKILEVKNLKVSFRAGEGVLKAVREVSFSLERGETLAIVGESGSGKSVTSKAILGILAGNAVVEGGEILYDGKDLLRLGEEEMQNIRGSKIAMIFQDPLSALDPIVKIGKQIAEAILLKNKRAHREGRRAVKTLLSELKKSVVAAMGASNSEIRREIEEKITRLKSTSFAVERVEAEGLLPMIRRGIEHDSYRARGCRKIARAAVEGYKSYFLSGKIKKREVFARAKSLACAVEDSRERLATSKDGVLNTFSDSLKSVLSDYFSSLSAGEAVVAVLDGLLSRFDELDRLPPPDVNERCGEFLSLLRNRLRESARRVSKREANERAIKLMEEVGIPDARTRFQQYPFEFSGGMRQRIVIATALAVNPDVLICDEPTTALDVTIQSQILELINKLKAERNLSVIFITHDLGVVANMADKIAVMYAGKIVEYGGVDDVFYDARHPYTWALLSSMPDLDTDERLDAIPGAPPNMIYPPKGDAFAERNKYALEIDFERQPPSFEISPTHWAATWLLHPDAPKVPIPDVIKKRIRRMKKKKGEGEGK